MATANIPMGLQHMQSLRVTEKLIAPAVSAEFTGFADMPRVFATAFMVGFVEWTCIEALRPYLRSSQRTLGVHVDLSHIAATPVGMRVTAEVELVNIEGRRLRFKVNCRDEMDVICTGYHDRAIIDHDKFLERLSRKTTGGT